MADKTGWEDWYNKPPYEPEEEEDRYARWKAYAIIVGISMAGAAVVTAGMNYLVEKDAAPIVAPNSVVRITTESGALGSGVMLPGGYLLTAGHVISKLDEKMTLDIGVNETSSVRVLWDNDYYDLALIKVVDRNFVSSVEASPLLCDTPVLGSSIVTVGYAWGDFRNTTWGLVGSRPGPVDSWPQAVTMGSGVVKGMSGGASFNASGEVVGITVGVSMVGTLNIMVPSSTVCALMGRVS